MKKIITIISVLLISVMFLYPLKVYAADSGVTKVHPFVKTIF